MAPTYGGLEVEDFWCRDFYQLSCRRRYGYRRSSTATFSLIHGKYHVWVTNLLIWWYRTIWILSILQTPNRTSFQLLVLDEHECRISLKEQKYGTRAFFWIAWFGRNMPNSFTYLTWTWASQLRTIRPWPEPLFALGKDVSRWSGVLLMSSLVVIILAALLLRLLLD